MSDKDNNTRVSKNNDTSDFSTAEKTSAVALGYDNKTDSAPKVLAKGEGDIASKIISIAQEHNIEIKQDADLLQILKAVDINEEIPIEAFAAVAEILSYIYKQNAKN